MEANTIVGLYLYSAFTNPMFLSTNSLSIVYTFSREYISISSHIVVCPLFNITSIHEPERNSLVMLFYIEVSFFF